MVAPFGAEFQEAGGDDADLVVELSEGRRSEDALGVLGILRGGIRKRLGTRAEN